MRRRDFIALLAGSAAASSNLWPPAVCAQPRDRVRRIVVLMSNADDDPEGRARAADLIVANGAANVAAVKDATRTVPIVFVVVNDPIGQGFIANLAQPGGN